MTFRMGDIAKVRAPRTPEHPCRICRETHSGHAHLLQEVPFSHLTRGELIRGIDDEVLLLKTLKAHRLSSLL